MRPDLSEETAEELEEKVDDIVRVPADVLGFEQQLEILLEYYDEQAEYLAEVRRQLEDGSATYGERPRVVQDDL